MLSVQTSGSCHFRPVPACSSMSHAAVAAVALRVFLFFLSLTQIHEKTTRLGFVCLHEYAYGEGRAIQQKKPSFSLD